MALKVVCDECSKEYQIDSAHAGKKARCKECGATMQIPSRPEERPSRQEFRARPKMKRPPEDEYEDYDVDQDDEDEYQPSRRRSASTARKRVSRGSTRTAGWGAGYSVGLPAGVYCFAFLWFCLSALAVTLDFMTRGDLLVTLAIASAFALMVGCILTPYFICWYGSQAIFGLVLCSSIYRVIMAFLVVLAGNAGAYYFGRFGFGLIGVIIALSLFRAIRGERARKFYGVT